MIMVWIMDLKLFLTNMFRFFKGLATLLLANHRISTHYDYVFGYILVEFQIPSSNDFENLFDFNFGWSSFGD